MQDPTVADDVDTSLGRKKGTQEDIHSVVVARCIQVVSSAEAKHCMANVKGMKTANTYSDSMRNLTCCAHPCQCPSLWKPLLT